MRSFIFRSASFLSRQVLPSLLVIALVFAPFPPLLLPSKHSEQNAKETYESTYGTNSPAPTIVARYTRGVSEPVITKDTADIAVSLVMGTSTVALPVLAEATPPETVTPAKLATTRSARVSPSAQANVAAAQQVAAGASASEVVEVGLDASLNIAETLDSHGARTLAEYNEAGDPVKITAPDGRVTYYAYDEEGNLTSMYSEKSKVVSRAGENPLAFLSRALSSSMRALAGETPTNSTALSYEGGAITEVKGGNSAVSFEYDASGNLSAQETDSGESIVYAYDEEGNVAGKEVRTLDTVVAQNTFTRILARVGLTGLARSYARAYAGTETLAQSEAYGYDASGELSAFSVSLGDEVAGQTVAVPTVAPISAPVLETQPATETALPAATTSEPVPNIEVPAVSVPEATTTAGTLVSFFRSSLQHLAYAFAPFMPRAFADMIDEIVAPAEEAPTPVTASNRTIGVWNTLDVLGNVVETQNEKGEITSYRYDSRTDAPTGRTVYDPQGAVLIDVSYGFDSSTNRWTSRAEGGVAESYEYDQSGELTTVKGGVAGAYRYDEHGNRVEKAGANGTVAYSYSGNRLDKETSSDGSSRSYTYDETGSVVSVVDSAKGTTRFSYDTRGAVSRIELPDGTNIRYTYDALNRRVGKNVAGPSSNEDLTYRYEGANLTRVVGADGSTLRQYIYGPKNNLIAIVAGGATYSVVLDSHGSVVALTDKDSKVTARFSYDAWGTPTSSIRSDLTDFYYASGFYEPLVGVYLLGPRTYDPSIGRFLQKDPLAGSLMDVISQNEYLYAGNDPINRTDPTGHQSVEANVGSSPRALASQARAAAEEMGTVVDAARARVSELTARSVPAEQVAIAEEAYEVAKAAQKDMTTLAHDNEARVEELESAARAALLLEQTVLPTLATTTEATTTPTVLPVDVATSTAPTIAVSATEASTTVAVPEPVVPAPPAPAPEVAAPVAPEQAVAPSTPEAVTAPAGPVTFIGATGQVVLSAFKDFTPLAFAKKSKAKPAKKKSPPPPPKKSKAKAPPPPPKVTKQAKVTKASKDLASLSKSVAKITAAVASLNKTLAIQKPIVLPALAKVAQATKVQTAKIVVAPQVASTKKDAVSKLVSAPSGAKIAQVSVAVSSSMNAQLEQIAKGIKAAQDKQAADKALADARAKQLVAAGRAKVMPVVNSPAVKNAQYGLALCGFEQTFIGGTCGVVDGFVYGLQGNGTSAGLSFAGALPLGAGLAFDAAKSARLASSQAIASSIARGHAFGKHIEEFGPLGIGTEQQLVEHAMVVIKNPTHSKILDRGRTAYYDMTSNTLVIYDPSHIDLGTILRPGGGLDYFTKLK